ncbi:MAG TPA: SLBB domain-containing protein [Candidatus Eisenbacteria bacterium]|nr:SLBB domain-containing protein [Candidatus Eisenbacteria bacterium]
MTRGIMIPLNRTRTILQGRFPSTVALVAALTFPSGALSSAFGQAVPDPATVIRDARDSRSAAPLATDPAIEGRVDPETYRVGPGDEFALRTSDLLEPRVLRVGPSGEFLLPDAGSIPLAGLTLKEADARVRERLRPYVRGKGFVFALHRPRRFGLRVLGDVVTPGVVTLQAPVRASEAIQAAGGVTDRGARRGIQVRRGTDTLLVDLVRYERAGDVNANPLVFETDVIHVPPTFWTMDVMGAVAHPGRYDYVEGDRVSDLLALGGGLRSDAALDQAQLKGGKEFQRPETVPVRVSEALASNGGTADPLLRPGDVLYVPAIAHYLAQQHVVLEGEIARPGPYPIEEGVTRIRTVLEQAGGFTPFANRSGVRVERPITQAPPDTAFLRIANEQGPLLSPVERLYVMTRARERNAVSAPVGMLLEAGDANGDVALYDGDRIVVPRSLPFVSVQGEVRSPGHVPFREGWKVNDYVKAAGNYTGRAYKSRTRVTQSTTGSPLWAADVKEVRSGDVIWVPTEPDRNPWGTLRDIVVATAAAASIVIAVEAVTD